MWRSVPLRCPFSLGDTPNFPCRGGTGRICISCSWFVFLCLLYLEQPTPATDYAAMGSETEPRSKCRVSTDGRSELHVRRKSLVCDSAGDGWTTMSDWVKLAQWAVGSVLWYAVFLWAEWSKIKGWWFRYFSFFFFFSLERDQGEDNGSQHVTSSWGMEEEGQKKGDGTLRGEQQSQVNSKRYVLVNKQYQDK